MSQFCINCGAENLDGAKFCKNCGVEILKTTKSEDENTPKKLPETVSDNTKNPYIAILLSAIIPGLGVIYAGKFIVVARIMISYIVFLALCSWTGLIHMPYGGIFFYLLSALIYVGLIIYSFIASKKVTHLEYETYNKSLIYLVVVVIFAYFFSTISGEIFGFKAFRIPASSMSSSLLIGDHIIVNTWAYKNKSPSRGDIVVFQNPNNIKQVFIKRCIAIEGDELFVLNKDLYLHQHKGDDWIKSSFKEEDIVVYDGKLWVKNPYMKEHKGIHHDEKIVDDGKYPESLFNFAPIKVEKGNYFMMGDNRDHSNDSRFWGTVHQDFLVGTVSSIYYSDNEDGVRLDRIGSSSYN
jgi:signal peptidase I